MKKIGVAYSFIKLTYSFRAIFVKEGTNKCCLFLILYRIVDRDYGISNEN